MVVQSICLSLVALLLSASVAARPVKNGFDLAGALLPPTEIRRGGPPRDGIPAIYTPKFVRAGEQSDVEPDDRVLGVFVDGIAKAYPVAILDYHEVVNDWTQATHMVITYCPLCGSGMAFHAGADGQGVFGVSGLLYNSDVLLYDHGSESLWSQILGKAIAGPKRGELLDQIPLAHVKYAQWLERHPASWVLSRETGYKGINYGRGPEGYRGYERSRRVFFPVSSRDDRYHPKSWVLGIQADGVTKAYPFEELRRTSGVVRDRLGEREITVRYADEAAWAEDDQGNPLTAIRLFWFAWIAFHPDTEVYTAAAGDG